MGGDVPRTAANIDKARRLLGYEPTVPFVEGIRRLVKWYTTEYQNMSEEPELAVPMPKSTSQVSLALGAHSERRMLIIQDSTAIESFRERSLPCSCHPDS